MEGHLRDMGGRGTRCRVPGADGGNRRRGARGPALRHRARPAAAVPRPGRRTFGRPGQGDAESSAPGTTAPEANRGATPHPDRRCRLRRIPGGPDPVPDVPGQGRHHPAQPDRLLPVPAPAAPGRRRRPGTAPGHRLPLRDAARGTARPRRGRRHRHGRAHRALHRARGARRHAGVRPAGAGGRQRQQAAADPRRRRARARLPRAARGAVPARPRHPAGGTRGGGRRPGGVRARCTFVVVGAGYTGTEVAAQGKTYTDAQVRRHPLRQGLRPRWLLLDVAPRVLPELDERLSRTADRVLRERGVDVRMGTSVREATHEGVVLTDGEFVPTRTLVWCVGVRPDPLVESVGEPLERGRLVVDPFLQVPGRPEVFACGDAAAVPDLDRPGEFTPMTAQHAWRQGRTAAVNVAASLGVGTPRPYRHRDLGFVVDLGGARAAANPLGVPLSGLAAGAVTRGYHLAAMPGNRVRVAADWLLNAVLPRQAVQLGLVRSWSVPLESASPELARVPGGPPREAQGSGGPGEGPGGSGAGADASPRGCGRVR
ncbi:NADH dehydrogenase [Streptomyces sp. e14]|nr:NADH dehydrogenase [Streptomyces sp. e14]